MFQPKVMASPEAILKNEVAVCWGWVMERTPAGAVGGMKMRLKLEVAGAAAMVGRAAVGGCRRARREGGKGAWELLQDIRLRARDFSSLLTTSTHCPRAARQAWTACT